MPHRQRTLSLSVAAALAAFAMPLAPAAFAQALPTDTVKLLVDQGNYWQAHGRGDLAAQSWQKLLQMNPKQPDALYGMGLVQADLGHTDRAQSYLDQLRQAAPGHPDIAKLAGRLGQSAPQNPTLSAARTLAQQGKGDAAVQQYRQALATDKTAAATPAVQLEYYQTLGGTSQGWDEARRGLEKLAHDNPDDARIALALAQHLTYRESTRRDGIRQLAALSTRDGVGAQAKASWRQALIWLGARSADEPLYSAYLKSTPDDAAVKARLDTLAQQERTARATVTQGAAVDVRGRTVNEGFQALQNGDLDTATARFQSVLADHPTDADALGGMGVLRLKQEKFAEAQDLLERASRGVNPARWRSALNSATYWSLVNSANALRQQGAPDDINKARAQLERAIKIDPNEVTAQNALGDLLLTSGDPKAAEAAYRMVLRRQSNNPDAIRGLVGALTAQNRSDEALQLAGQLSETQQQQIGGLGTLRAQQQQAAARVAVQSGDLATARTDLENALLNDPDSPWIRLDLARVYSQQGALTNARSVMDGLLVSHPDMPDALYASALLYSELGDWNQTLISLDRVPPQNRTRDMMTLQRRAWVHATTDRALALARQGQMGPAHALADQAAPVAGTDTELVGAVAGVYAETGDNNRALILMRQVLARTPRPDAGMRIQYAGILLRTQQDAELGGVLRQIQSMQLTPAQRTDYDKLQLAMALRQADQLREQGDLVNAYNMIAPALAAHPEDPDLQTALARMYSAAGEYDQALRLYTAAHRARPNDLDVTLAAAGAAQQAKQYDYAEQAMNTALKQAPANPRVLAAAGRLYRAEGKNSRAADYFKQSLAAENAPVNGANGPLDLRLVGRNGAAPVQGQYAPDRLPVNPFIGKTVVGAAAAPSSNGVVPQSASPVAYGAQPAPGQYSGTGGPSPAPAAQFGGATQAAYPYPTQPYSAQTMPYIPPNMPPTTQQAPAGYGYAPGAAPVNQRLAPQNPQQYQQPYQAPYQQPYRPSTSAAPLPDGRALAANGSMDSEGAGSAGSSNAGYGGAQNAGYGYQQSNGYAAPNGYAQNGYAPNGYPQQGYQQGYPQQGYAAPGGYQQGYQPGYQQAAYPQNGYQGNPQGGYAPNGYQAQPNGGYPQQGYAQQPAPYYPPNNVPNNGYSPNGYVPNGGYAQGGYPPNGYGQNGYPQQGYAQQGYAQQPAPYYPPNNMPNGYVPNGGYAQNGYPQNGGYPQQGGQPGFQSNGYAPPAGLWQPPASGYAQDSCDSAGADGGTTSAAGGGNAAAAEQTCIPPLPRRTVARKRVTRPAQRVAQQPRYPTYQQPYPQQPYQQPYQQPPQQYAQYAPVAAAPAGPAPAWNDSVATTPNRPLTVQDELDQINQERVSTVSAGVDFRSRGGEQGLSSMTDIETPIEGRVALGDGHVVVRATPVMLDSGAPDSTYAVSSRFGSGPAAAFSQSLTSSNPVGAQNANGIGVAVGYETNNVRADVGTTPIGFQQQNIVGGLNYRGAIGDQITYVIDASRRAVTDSILSYAGVKDSRTGATWGGITASGARLDATWDDGTNGVYGYGSYSFIAGTNVESNTRAEGGGGVYTRLISKPDEELTAGINVTGFAYNKNLSYFTFGQGGYFSPQQYLSLSIPLAWNQRSGKVSYQVKGSLGIQHFRQDDSPYFPTSGSLQTAANAAQKAAAAASLTTLTTAVYPGQTKTGIGYDLQAIGEYQLAPQVFLGGTLGLNNARDYSQYYGGVYLRYAFQKMTGALGMPPNPLHSPYQSN